MWYQSAHCDGWIPVLVWPLVVQPDTIKDYPNHQPYWLMSTGISRFYHLYNATCLNLCKFKVQRTCKASINAFLMRWEHDDVVTNGKENPLKNIFTLKVCLHEQGIMWRVHLNNDKWILFINSCLHVFTRSLLMISVSCWLCPYLHVFMCFRYQQLQFRDCRWWEHVSSSLTYIFWMIYSVWLYPWDFQLCKRGNIQ